MTAPVQIDTNLFTYHAGFKNLVRIVQVGALVIVALTGVLFHYVHDVIPRDSYYAQTVDGGNIPLVSLEDPNVNNEALLSWASQASVDVLTFGFNDLNDRFGYMQRYFSTEGWKTFATSVLASRLLANVTALQQIVTSIPAAPAQLVSWGYRNGTFSWVVYVPVIMTTRAGNNKTVTVADVFMTIIKLPTSENPRGMAIDSWISR